MITLPKNFKKVLLTGTALVAVSFVGVGQAQAQARVIDSAPPNLVNNGAIDGKWLTTNADNKFININIDNTDATLGAVASSAVTITNNNQTIYIFDGNADTTVNKLTFASPALGNAVDNSAAANTLNIVLGTEGNTDTGVGTKAPDNSRNVHVVFGGNIVTHADGATNISLDATHGKSGNIIEFGGGVNLGKGALTLSSGVNGGTTDTARFTGTAAQTFTGNIAGAGIIDVATAKTVTFNGDVTANQMKLTTADAVVDGTAELKLNTIVASENATVSNKITLSGADAGTTVDAGKTLTLTGAGSALGKATIGAGGTLHLNHAAGDANKVTVGDIDAASGTLQVGSGTADVTGTSVALANLNFSGAGVVTFTNATATGATEIDFNNNTGFVTFGAANVNFAGNAKSTGGANGTVTFAGAGATASGTFGGGAAGTALSVLNVGSGADAASLNLTSANAQYISTINVNNATLTTNGNLNGTTHLTHANSKLIVNDGKNLINAGGAAITAANGVGTVEFVGSSTVTGTVGATGARLASIDVQGDNTKTVTFSDAVFANELKISNGGTATLSKGSAFTTVNVGTGILNLNEASGYVANFDTGTTGTVNVAAGANLVNAGGNVLSGTGTVNLAGNANILGAYAAGTLNINGTNATNAVLEGDGTIGTVTFADDGRLESKGNLTITNAVTTKGTIALSSGNLTATGGLNNADLVLLLNNSTAAATVTGPITQIGTLNVSGTNTTTFADATFNAAKIDFAAAGTVDISAATTAAAQAVNFKGNDGTVRFGNGVTYTGTVTNDTTNNKGIVEFGNNAVINGVIGAVGADSAINTLKLTGDATVNSDVYADTVSVGAGAVTFTGANFTATNVNFDGNGTLNLTGAANKIVGNVTATNPGNGAVTFKDGFEITGNVDRLREMKLVGGAKIGGNAQAANTTEILTHTLEVGGTYTVGAGTQLVYQVNTPTTSGQIKAGGAVTVDAGAKVNMIVDTGVYVTQGHKFVLIDGNGGNGVATLAAGNLTTTSTALLHFRQDTTNTEDLVVYADRTMMGSIEGSTPNTAAIGVVLDGVADKGGADVTALQIRLANMPDASQVTQTLETLLPDVGAGAATSVSNVGTTTSTIASNRLAQTRGNSGMSAGNEAMWGNAHVWMQGFGGKAEQDNREGIAGYDAETWGGVVGADVSVTDALRAGLAFAYANTEVDSNSRNIGQTDIDSYQFMLYGDYDLGSNTFIAGQLGYMRSNVDTKRYNVGGLANNTARGEYDIDQYSARAELGRDIVRDSMTLTPSLFANYSYMDFGSYSETGVGGLGLRNVSADDMSVFELGLNVSNEWTFDDGMGGFVKPGLHGGFRYDFINDAVGTTARLAGGGAAFKTNGVKSEPHTFNLGASLGWELQSNVELKAHYDYETKDDYEAHSGYVRVGVRF